MNTPRRADWKTIADQFLAYFREQGHAIVASSSLVPADDPTLLFTNAGMVQFKDVFLGLEQRAYRRAASLQKCMRVQGKHNDLENVGPSPRHQTFFLMLGNFSFGDYFKREAIAFAWELMTRRYGIDPQRLIITIFEADEEAASAWRAMGVSSERVLRMSEKTNFWMMADVGPCGPTSELHYDWGPEYCTCGAPDCSVALDNECLRWLEVWNLVFMQYNQKPDGTRVPLPKPGVDTGMGLERVVSVLQGVNDDYQTDLFHPIMNRLRRILEHTDAQRQAAQLAYRVMADHGRAMTFLMADGVIPSNEGRGYVLRMIIRRAMRFGRTAGIARPFLAELAGAVIDEMGRVYPELEQQRAFIQAAARSEEERFTQTLTSGLDRLEALIADVQARGARVLPGEEVFRLYDTYGFPVEMTRDVARERGLEIDEPGFAQAMQAQRERARAAQAFAAGGDEQRFAQLLAEGVTTEFIGYGKHSARAKVVALFTDGRRVADAPEGARVEVILDRTPFYPEGGGQVGDTGVLRSAMSVVDITDAQRPAAGLVVHHGTVGRGRVRVGQSVRAEIDRARRWDIMRNHTATHLLHRALHEVLGEHARQAGSLVAPDRLRFDFVHLAPLTPPERETVEQRVNEQILADLPVRARWMRYDDAVAAGAMALFGEKYGDRVRVISIDEYSRELCGGTHLTRTSQVGVFKVTAEGGVAAGIRRIEAVSGRGAYALMTRQDQVLRVLSERLRVGPEDVPDRVARLLDRERALERELRAARTQAGHAFDVGEHTAEVDGISYVFVEADAADADELRTYADRIRTLLDRQQRPGLVVIGSTRTGAVVVTRTATAPPTLDAGKFAQVLTEAFGGGGGGRPTLGQGGIKDAGRIADMVRQGRDEQFLRTLLQKLAASA